MLDSDAISRRLLSLSEALGELARPEAGDAAALARDTMLRAAVERWLQVAIEACVDVATHCIAAQGWTPPGSAREAFQVLAAHGRIPLELAQRLSSAAGLRNILVHEYVAVDLTRLAGVVRNDLDDLREFARHAAQWLGE